MGQHASRGNSRGVLGLLLLSLLASLALIAEVDNRLASSLKSHTQDGRSRSKNVALGNVKLKSGNTAALDRLKRLLNLGLNSNETLRADAGDPLNHGLADNRLLLRGHNYTLNIPVSTLSQLDKAHLGTLNTRVLEPSADNNSLSIVRLVKVSDLDLLGILAESSAGDLLVSVAVLGGVVGEAQSSNVASKTLWLKDNAVDCAIKSRENSDTSMPA